jgi:hypothetical protein
VVRHFYRYGYEIDRRIACQYGDVVEGAVIREPDIPRGGHSRLAACRSDRNHFEIGQSAQGGHMSGRRPAAARLISDDAYPYLVHGGPPHSVCGCIIFRSWGRGPATRGVRSYSGNA